MIKSNLYKSLCFFINLIVFYLVFLKFSYGYDLYDVERPKRKYLNQNYQYNIDVDENIGKILSIENIGKVFVKKRNEILDEKDKTEEELYADKGEADLEKQKFKEKVNKKDEVVESQIEKKEDKKTWLDDWIPKIETKPFEMIGMYTIFKLMMAYPFDSKISANEITQLSDVKTDLNLFTGTAKFYIMPSIFISVGNDKFKYWRYEVELGYIPILASNTGETVATKDVPNYTFYPEKKDLSFHLMTISFNNFLQYAFFDKRLVGYVGIGIGAGYAWTMGNTLSSDFVLPYFSGMLGVSFMVGKKSKLNIGYTVSYTNVSLPNNFSFNRTNAYGVNANNKAIQGGHLKFSNFLINGLSIEYQFYTA